MIITIGPDLEAALNRLANKQGVEPEVLAINALRERFLAPRMNLEPQDDWERQLLSAGSDCGVALSNEAVGSDGIYD